MDDRTRADKNIDPADDGTPAAVHAGRRAGRTARPHCAPKGFEFSPINSRRWQNFKANRRGYWSFWIFLVLFVVSLFAEFIANDKPFYVRLRRQVLLPGLRHLSGDRPSAAISRPRPTIAIPICRS